MATRIRVVVDHNGRNVDLESDIPWAASADYVSDELDYLVMCAKLTSELVVEEDVTNG